MIMQLEKPSLLLVGRIEFATEEWEEIENAYSVKYYESGNRLDFLSKCKDGVYDGVLAVGRSNQFNYLTGDFDEELLSTLPGSVEAICNIGAGVNTINVQHAHACGITVTNTPSVGADAVADMTIFLMLGALRRGTACLSRIRQDRWQQETPVGLDPQGRILGICGMGNIGATVADRALAFGMRVQYYSRSSEKDGYRVPPEHSHRVFRAVSFEELVRTSDVISIHSPLNKDTHHMFNKEQFKKMKKGVVIVNTARGGVVDQKALIEAVQEGDVWAAGLDVYEEEPAVPVEMRDDERFFMLPHVATKTHGARGDMERVMMRNVVAAMEHQPLHNPVKN